MLQPPHLEGRPVTFRFCDQTLYAIIGPTSEAYIPLAPLCTVLGIAWAEVLVSFSENPIYTFTARTVQLPQGAGVAQSAELIALPMELAARWLIELDDSAIQPDLLPLLWQHKEGCYRIMLNDYMRFAYHDKEVPFKLERLLAESDEPLAVLYKQGIEHIAARQQVRLQNEPLATRIQGLERRMKYVENRQG